MARRSRQLRIRFPETGTRASAPGSPRHCQSMCRSTARETSGRSTPAGRETWRAGPGSAGSRDPEIPSSQRARFHLRTRGRRCNACDLGRRIRRSDRRCNWRRPGRSRPTRARRGSGLSRSRAVLRARTCSRRRIAPVSNDRPRPPPQAHGFEPKARQRQPRSLDDAQRRFSRAAPSLAIPSRSTATVDRPETTRAQRPPPLRTMRF